MGSVELIVAALAAGAGNALEGTATDATANAYASLKDLLKTRTRDRSTGAIAMTPSGYLDLPHEDPGTRFAEVLSALRADAGIPLRALEPKVGKSAATLSRIFNGKIMPTRSVLGKILAALETPAGTGQQIMQLWAAAMSANAGPGKPKASTAAANEQETDIVVHGGSIAFTDKAATGGRVVMIHGGDVFFSPEAARAARQIIVHGGNVEVSDQPASFFQHDGGAHRDDEDLPAAGGHLRSVS
ncbi:helix-turn-helix domain-containing protein (plasmid) [Actinoplanes sp. CA-051413]|uniref:helix-turn-helix domain-containing protein n=1 Tax=Actinoplanes sp. CA-051413 TaxID=3239899 RepID=UPI003D9810FA